MVISSIGEKKLAFGIFSQCSRFETLHRNASGVRYGLSSAGLLLHCTITIVGTRKAQVKNFLVQRTI